MSTMQQIHIQREYLPASPKECRERLLRVLAILQRYRAYLLTSDGTPPTIELSLTTEGER